MVKFFKDFKSFFIAAASGDIKIVKTLINKNPCLLNDKNGSTVRDYLYILINK